MVDKEQIFSEVNKINALIELSLFYNNFEQNIEYLHRIKCIVDKITNQYIKD